jgi:hypothetical protein
VKFPNGIRRCLLLLVVTACASTPSKTAQGPAPAAPPALPPVTLRPADQARPALAFVLSAESPLRLAADLDALASGLQLPVPLGQAALDRLAQTPLGGVSLTRAQLDRLDPGESLGLAMLVGNGDLICAAFSFKDAALAQRTLEELGPEVQRLEGASARKLPSSGVPIWTGISGRTLLTAPSRDALLAAGAVAMEAQRAPRDGQAMFTVYPQNLARAQGVPLANLVEMAAAAMSARLEAAAPPPAAKGKGKGKKDQDAPELTPAMNRMMIAFFKAGAQPIVEAEVVHLTVKLGTADGVRLRTEIVPLAGTPSASRTKTVPYALDPKLGVGDDRTTVFAFSEAGAGVTALIGAFASTGPSGKAMSQQLATLVNEVVGGGSCTMRSLAPLDNLCAFQLRPGTTPARALDSYAQAFKNSQAWNDELLGKKKTKVTVRRSKELVEIDVQTAGLDARSRALTQAMWGGDVQRYAIAVRDARLVQAQGAKPKEILRRWDQPGRGAAPIFDGVASRTRGAEVLAFVDLMSMVGAGTKAADDPSVRQVGAMMNAVPGLAELRAPLVLAVWGGKTTAIDLQLPYQSLVNVAQVVRPFMGMMGGPPPSGPRR